MSAVAISPVPTRVDLIYRLVGDTHVFTSKGLKGVVHVGSADREAAFNNVLSALGKHVQAAYGCEAKYVAELTYEEFCRRADAGSDIAGNFLVAHTAEASARPCH